MITKALGPSGITEDGQVQVVYTRRLTGADVADPAAGAATAPTLQPFVPKAFEVRLTVIGLAMFPVAIHADTGDARTDWRPRQPDHHGVPAPQNPVGEPDVHPGQDLSRPGEKCQDTDSAERDRCGGQGATA